MLERNSDLDEGIVDLFPFPLGPVHLLDEDDDVDEEDWDEEDWDDEDEDEDDWEDDEDEDWDEWEDDDEEERPLGSRERWN